MFDRGEIRLFPCAFDIREFAFNAAGIFVIDTGKLRVLAFELTRPSGGVGSVNPIRG
jgi:hypothetical protein